MPVVEDSKTTILIASASGASIAVTTGKLNLNRVSSTGSTRDSVTLSFDQQKGYTVVLVLYRYQYSPRSSPVPSRVDVDEIGSLSLSQPKWSKKKNRRPAGAAGLCLVAGSGRTIAGFRQLSPMRPSCPLSHQ